MVAVGIPHKQDEQSSTYTNDVECGIPVDTSHDDSRINTQAQSNRSNNVLLYTQTHVRERCKMVYKHFSIYLHHRYLIFICSLFHFIILACID